MMTCGAILTPQIERYPTFCDGGSEIRLPDSYRLDTLEVYDQGADGSCVSCTVTEMMYLHDSQRGLNISHDFPALFYRREDKSMNGMTPVEAFEMLRSDGVIQSYARMRSAGALRQSIITHGAAMAVLMVRSDGTDFWNGDGQLGYHAVPIVGWTTKELIIKNSWGTGWGENGFCSMPWREFGLIRELWTILS